MKANLKNSLIVLVLLPLLFACGNKTRLKVNPNDRLSAIDVVEGVSFDDVFKTILEPQCLTCHPGYSNYSAVAGESDKILEQIVIGRMPKGGPAITDPDTLALISSWVKAGSPLEAGGESSESVPLAATFESIFVNIIVPKCIVCHNGTAQAIGPRFYNFSDYESFIASNVTFEEVNGFPFMDQLDGADSELIFLFEDNKMPPTFLPGNDSYNESPLEQLTPEEIAVFTEWIIQGSPNN